MMCGGTAGFLVETAVFGVQRHCNVNEQEDNNRCKKSLTYVTYLELQKCI
jgi:hypothetical protein